MQQQHASRLNQAPASAFTNSITTRSQNTQLPLSCESLAVAKVNQVKHFLQPDTLKKWRVLWLAQSFDETRAVLSVAPMLPDFGKSCPATAMQAIATPSASLATLKKYQSADFMEASVGRLIAMYAGLLNIGKNLQPFQISTIASELCADYHYLTLVEVQYVMKQGVKGAYGKLYDHLDISVILEWFAQYDAERVEIAASRAREAHKMIVKENAEWQDGCEQRLLLSGGSGPIEAPPFIAELIEKLEGKEKARPMTDFEPDKFYWAMVEDEYAKTDKSLTLAEYKEMRLAQTKASFSRSKMEIAK